MANVSKTSQTIQSLVPIDPGNFLIIELDKKSDLKVLERLRMAPVLNDPIYVDVPIGTQGKNGPPVFQGHDDSGNAPRIGRVIAFLYKEEIEMYDYDISPYAIILEYHSDARGYWRISVREHYRTIDIPVDPDSIWESNEISIHSRQDILVYTTNNAGLAGQYAHYAVPFLNNRPGAKIGGAEVEEIILTHLLVPAYAFQQGAYYQLNLAYEYFYLGILKKEGKFSKFIQGAQPSYITDTSIDSYLASLGH